MEKSTESCKRILANCRGTKCNSYGCACVYIHVNYFQYQRLEFKVCRGRVFNSKAVAEACKGQGHFTLSPTHLTEYYNEFVIQLKLAEYNYNETISMEIKENYMTAALNNEEIVIKILNESILPALEFMVSCIIICTAYLTSFST